MNQILFQLDILSSAWVVTPWKLIGYLGVATFAGRWFVQLLASHQAGRPRFPRLFWHMSLIGSVLLLCYFTFSDKNDSVGVFSNLFPCGIALYNLMLDYRHQRRRAVTAPVDPLACTASESQTVPGMRQITSSRSPACRFVSSANRTRTPPSTDSNSARTS
jgi:lipid-A-disaccharide synthase-like uncharacterized protein